MKRVRLKARRSRTARPAPDAGRDNGRGGRYFKTTAEQADNSVPRIKSGCTLLDCALGGGWAKGRVINIVGDKSTGKTLQATEICANFVIQYGPDCRIRYKDTEAAYDVAYAETVGLPTDAVDFGEEIETIEDFERDLTKFCKEIPRGMPGLYILDSLDALSSNEEMDVKYDAQGNEKGSYGLSKAKKMSALFRRCIRAMKRKDVTLVVISQVRDNINAMFGEKYTRSGGKALDFYASQIVWLSELGKIKAKRAGVERKVGVDIKAMVKKNKCGKPWREAEYPIMYDYGVEDVRAGVVWLHAVKRLAEADLGLDVKQKEGEDDEPKRGGFGAGRKQLPAALTKFFDKMNEMDDAEFRSTRKRVNKAVRRVWREIELTFAPPRRKYQ
jgi:RecA/RadA recombinase